MTRRKPALYRSDVTMSETRPFIRFLRGRSIMALVLTPGAAVAQLAGPARRADRTRAELSSDGRPVIVDLGTLLPRETADVARLDARHRQPRHPHHRHRGRAPCLLGRVWKPGDASCRAPASRASQSKCPNPPHRRARATATLLEALQPAFVQACALRSPSMTTQAEPPSLLIDRSVRSGQSIAFEHGADITMGTRVRRLGCGGRGRRLDPRGYGAPARPSDRRFRRQRESADILPQNARRTGGDRRRLPNRRGHAGGSHWRAVLRLARRRPDANHSDRPSWGKTEPERESTRWPKRSWS